MNDATNPAQLQVRPYRPADRDACLAVFDSNVPHAMMDHEREPFLETLAHPDVRYFVAEDNASNIIACAGYDAISHRLCWGMVHRHHQREGIGTLLLSERLRRLRDECGAVDVHLDTSQVGKPFFLAMGFEVIGELEDHYAPGVHRYDMILRAETPAP